MNLLDMTEIQMVSRSFYSIEKNKKLNGNFFLKKLFKKDVSIDAEIKDHLNINSIIESNFLLTT